MTCFDVRAALPALVEQQLTPEEAGQVEKHLTDCAACRRERQALAHVCRLLDQLPVPTATVDLPALYRRAAEREERRALRWRRLAVAGVTAAAACLLLTLGLRLEVRVEAHQAVVRWGMPPDVAVPPSPPSPSPAAVPSVNAEDVALLRSLVHALAEDVATRDRRQHEALARVEGDVLDARRQADRRFNTNERTVAAVVTLIQTAVAQRGEKP